MKKKKSKCICLAVAVTVASFCFSGCGTENPIQNVREQENAHVEEQEKSEPADNSETETPQNIPDTEREPSVESTETSSENSSDEEILSPLREKAESLTVLFSSEWLCKWNKQETQYLLETTFNIPKLSSEDEKEYPKLAKALTQYGRSERKRMKKIHKKTAKEVEEIGIGAGEWTIRNWFSVSRADSRLVSLMTKYSDYLGGAHGMFYTDGVNFDSVTGKQLLLKDIFVSTEELPALLEKKLVKKYGRDAFFEKEDGKSIFSPIIEAREASDGTEKENTTSEGQTENNSITLKEEEYTWCVTNDGVMFYFAPYQIGPYGSGEFECLIPFRQKDLFYPAYTETAEKYARELAWDYEDGMGGALSYLADLDGDGKRDKLKIERTASDQYGADFHMNITYNGKKWKNEIHGYSFSPVLVHLKNKKNYLYLGVTMENDYPDMYVFSLSDKGVKKVCSKALRFHGETDQEEQYYTSAPANPEKFKLDTRLDTLSTYTGWKRYHVGKNGRPVADMPYYRIESSIIMTSLRDMKLAVVGKNGKKIKKVRVPKGNKFTFYRTDAKKYVDMKLSDGRIVRLHIGGKGEDWSERQTVEGKTLEETFEGFMFAG